MRVNPSLVHGPEGQARISLRSDSDPVRAWSGPEEYHLLAHVNRPQDTVAEDYHYHFPTFDAPDTYLFCYNPLCEQSTFVPLSLLASAKNNLTVDADPGLPQDDIIPDDGIRDWDEASDKLLPGTFSFESGVS